MKHKFLKRLLGVCAWLCASLLPQVALGQQWSLVYNYLGDGVPLSSLNGHWGGVTHMALGDMHVNADGSLHDVYGVSSQFAGAVSTIHANGAKATLIISDVCSSCGDNMRAAVDGHLSTLVTNLHNIVVSNNFDGVNIDWETTFPSSNTATEFSTFFSALRSALGSTKLIEADAFPTGGQNVTWWNTAIPYIDKIAMMCYDLNNKNGWSWFNSPLFNGSTPANYDLTSVDSSTQAFLGSGSTIPASKLLIGIPTYGDFQTGASSPRLNSGSRGSQIHYATIVSNYGLNPNTGTSGSTIWDSVSQTPWLPLSGQYVTYDNAQSFTAKVNYAKSRGLGGVMVFNFVSDYIPSNNPQHPLLAAIETAMGGSSSTPTAPTISTTSPLPAGSVGTAYSQALSASGSTPITWGITSGALPAGLTLSSSTGTISGTPTATGTSTFTAQATNSVGNNSKSFSLTINATAPVITSFTASPSRVSAGGSSTLSWSTTGATVLSIDQGIGTVTGTTSKSVAPTSTTTYTLTATGTGGSVHSSVTVTIRTACAIGTPQGTAMPSRAATDSDLLMAADQSQTTLSAAVNNTTLTLPVTSPSTFVQNQVAAIDSEQIKLCSITGGGAGGGSVPSEIGLLFQNPNGFAESAASAVVFPAKSASTGASASALKIMHGRYDIFMPDDDNQFSWFPYASFTSYAATQAAAGHPLFVTATYQSTHRPVYFLASLGLDGGGHPTAPSSQWRRLVKTDDPRFINFWVNNYARPIVYQNVTGQQHLWVGLDECYFLSADFGVIDNSGVFQNVTVFDSPFPQNESQLLAMLGSFFTQLKTIAPDIPVMPNLASGLADRILTDPANFSSVFHDAAGVMVENIYVPSTDDFVRSQFYANLYNVYNFGAAGKTALLRANMPSGNATASRTSLIIYLLMRGANFFYAPNLGLNPSTDITAEDPADYKPAWDALGNPTAPLQSTQLGPTVNDRLYSRVTRNGIVYLNWSGATRTVTLPTGATYVNRSSSVVTQLTIPDLTGDYVLLQTPSSGGATTLTACSSGRGFAGTTAASHAQGAAVRGAIFGVYHNQAVAELRATQTWISTSPHPGGFPGTALAGASWPNHVATIPELYWMTDFSQELLTAPLTAGATSAVVSDGSCYHASQIALSDSELYEIGGVSSNTLSSLTRGIGGTTAAAHVIGASVLGVIATTDWNRIMTELAATEADLYGRAGSTVVGICGTSCTATAGVSWPNHAVTASELTVATAGASLTAAMQTRFVHEVEAFTADLKAHP